MLALPDQWALLAHVLRFSSRDLNHVLGEPHEDMPVAASGGPPTSDEPEPSPVASRPATGQPRRRAVPWRRRDPAGQLDLFR